MPLAKEGLKCIIALLALGLLSLFLSVYLGLFFLALSLFCMFFFRNPKRVCPQKPGTIYSPADGKITEICSVSFDDKDYNRITIFLSIFNCHINRIPYKGRIASITHHLGSFLAAYRKSIEDKNERCETRIDTAFGQLKVVQITGAIARRIINRLDEKESVETGSRFGLIMFGSRTDLYLPNTCDILVKKGDRLKAGLSVVAKVPLS